MNFLNVVNLCRDALADTVMGLFDKQSGFEEPWEDRQIALELALIRETAVICVGVWKRRRRRSNVSFDQHVDELADELRRACKNEIAAADGGLIRDGIDGDLHPTKR